MLELGSASERAPTFCKAGGLEDSRVKIFALPLARSFPKYVGVYGNANRKHVSVKRINLMDESPRRLGFENDAKILWSLTAIPAASSHEQPVFISIDDLIETRRLQQCL